MPVFMLTGVSLAKTLFIFVRTCANGHFRMWEIKTNFEDETFIFI